MMTISMWILCGSALSLRNGQNNMAILWNIYISCACWYPGISCAYSVTQTIPAISFDSNSNSKRERNKLWKMTNNLLSIEQHWLYRSTESGNGSLKWLKSRYRIRKNSISHNFSIKSRESTLNATKYNFVFNSIYIKMYKSLTNEANAVIGGDRKVATEPYIDSHTIIIMNEREFDSNLNGSVTIYHHRRHNTTTQQKINFERTKSLSPPKNRYIYIPYQPKQKRKMKPTW